MAVRDRQQQRERAVRAARIAWRVTVDVATVAGPVVQVIHALRR